MTGAPAAPAEEVVRGTCHHDCPDSCGWEVTVRDGAAVSLRGAPDHPMARGELCPKVNHLVARAVDPSRLRTPLRRVGPKGSGAFEPCTWDEALELAAAGIRAAIDRHGPETLLPYSSAGTQGLLQMGSTSSRLFHHLGASILRQTICGPTAGLGATITLGEPLGIDPLDLRHSRHIVLWGTNTRVTNRHLWPVIEEAHAAGARIVVVDPLRTATAEAADDHHQLLPGTDVALALGLVHELVSSGLVDHDYVQRCTTGFEELADAAAGWTAERTADVCGLDAEGIRRLAHDLGTIRPSAIRVLIGAEHTARGAEAFRAVACIPSITGAWRDRGGGLCRSTGVYASRALDEAAVQRPDLLAGRSPRSFEMGRLGDMLRDATLAPPITTLVVFNSNPAAIVPDRRRVLTGLARDDLFTVVLEQTLTDTARHADVVLPATTQLEHLDLVPAWGHLYLGLNRPAVAPIGESLPNTEIFRRLARALGVTEPAVFASDEDLLADALGGGSPLLDGIDRARLERETWVRLALPEDWRPFAPDQVAARGRRIALASDAWRSLGFGPTPAHDDSVHVGRDPQHPLRLITMKLHARFLNSSYSHLPRHLPAEGEPMLDISAADAAARGLADGDLADVWNERGRLRLRVRISERVRPGVVAAPFGWVGDAANVNDLTTAAPTDAGGSAYHDTDVQVALAAS